MKWHRTDFGYYSDNKAFFLERGARMTHGSNAWLIWQRIPAAELQQEGGGSPFDEHAQYARHEAELFHCDYENAPVFPEGDWYVQTCEEGWLADAKAAAQELVDDAARERAQLEDPTFLNRTCKRCGTHYHDSGEGERVCPNCGWKAWYAGPSVTGNTEVLARLEEEAEARSRGLSVRELRERS